MIDGPTNPPSTPIELMNARPPAAARPVRNRGGMVQKSARALFTPVSAIATAATETQNSSVITTALMKPSAASAQAIARLVILLRLLRSTNEAHAIMPALATA